MSDTKLFTRSKRRYWHIRSANVGEGWCGEPTDRYAMFGIQRVTCRKCIKLINQKTLEANKP